MTLDLRNKSKWVAVLFIAVPQRIYAPATPVIEAQGESTWMHHSDDNDVI